VDDLKGSRNPKPQAMLIVPPMKNYLIPVICIILTFNLGAATLVDTTGTSYDGDIIEVDGAEVIVSNGEQSYVIELSQLDADSAAAVEAWKAENPGLIDIPKKLEENPVPVKTSQPDNRSHEAGMVAVFVIIGEDGKVIDAYVHKSSNEKLNDSSVQAVKKWRFKPGKIGGKSSVCKILIPFRYSS